MFARLLAAAALLTASATASAQVTATWNNTAGDWNDPTRWNTNPLFPNGNYNAIINAGAVTVNQNITIQGLTFNNGTITRTNDLTVNAALTWTAGTLNGPGTLQVNGGGSSTNNTMVASGGQIRFGGGTFTQSQTILRLNDGAQASVGNGGVYVLAAPSFGTSFDRTSGTGSFAVEAGGTLRKTGGAAHNVTAGVTLTNGGTLDVQQGTFVIVGGIFNRVVAQ